MKLIRLFLIAAVLSSFLSCSKDDNVSTSSDKLVGQWKLTEFKYTGTSTVGASGNATSFAGTGIDLDLHI